MPLFHIPTHLPFLDCLAAGVLRLIPGESPERLSRVTILLPTRRSARALRTSFLRAAEGQTLLLPRMRALAGLSTEDADELALPTLLDLPPAVDPLQRQAVLTNSSCVCHATPAARRRPSRPGRWPRRWRRCSMRSRSRRRTSSCWPGPRRMRWPSTGCSG
ncbi:hypothetical protein ACFQY5_09165 [Paeniroseomonas aquatica]|uniref:hypothetical protein n=1 Tax=Paeniroseomonas aquatica TaxID=373043 RepID=UPI003609DE07